jgi:hypothetical protein
MRGRCIARDVLLALGEVPQSLMCLFAAIVSGRRATWITQHSLERVQPLLPAAVALDADLHASKDHLLAPTEVDAQLDDIAILYSERFRLDVRLTETNVVEESTRRALHILDIPAAVFAPQLAVLPADHLRLEPDRRSRRAVGRYFRCSIALRISSYADYRSLVGQGAVDGGEYERGSAGSGVLVWDESNRREVLDSACALSAVFHRWCTGGSRC